MRWRCLPTVLVTLDLARVTGWASGHFHEVEPTIGSWELTYRDPGDAQARRIAELDAEIANAFDQWCPSHVVCAAPFRARTKDEAFMKYGMLAIVRAECWRRDIDFLEQSESTVRKELLGIGRSKTQDMKALAIQWATREGLHVADHNEADAAVMWRWARDEIVRQWMAERGITDRSVLAGMVAEQRAAAGTDRSSSG